MSNNHADPVRLAVRLATGEMHRYTVLTGGDWRWIGDDDIRLVIRPYGAHGRRYEYPLPSLVGLAVNPLRHGRSGVPDVAHA